jgi:hypothetical protein
MTTTFSFNDFSDRDLLAEVGRLAASEREATARLVASLAEVNARRLYLSRGCSSLFVVMRLRLQLAVVLYFRVQIRRKSIQIP